MTRTDLQDLAIKGAAIRRQELLIELAQLDRLLGAVKATKRVLPSYGKRWSPARRARFSKLMKRRGWTAARRAKFKATMAAKKQQQTGGTTK